MTDQKQRPTFLTVICILSFIGSGFGILGGLIGLAGAKAITGAAKVGMDELESASSGFGGGMFSKILGTASASMEHYAALSLIGLIVAIISLIGVILMWKLKKSGFYLYTLANLGGLIIPVIVASFIVFSYFGAIITIAFIVMYAANLKAME